MKKIEGIIFDLDGVICSTDEYHFLAWKKLADQYGIYFDRTINNRLRGIGRRESLEIILEKSSDTFSEEQKDAMAEEKNKMYQQLLKTMTKKELNDGVYETLEKLRGKGILLAIGSSSKNAGLILQQIGLEKYFDFVADGNMITKTKPDPEVFLKAAQGIGLSPEQCLVVEDAQSGIEAAVNGCFLAAAIGDAAQKQLGDYQLDYFEKLIEIVK